MSPLIADSGTRAAARAAAGPAAAAAGPYGMTEANRTSLDVLLDLTRDELGGQHGLPDRPEHAFVRVD
jgi:hypothetical protein